MERRRIWPAKSLMWSFVLYLVAAASILYVIHHLNSANVPLLERSLWVKGFQPICLLALGFIQFKLVKQYLDIKFNQFLARIYYEIWLMIDDNLYFVQFRRSFFTPWWVCELNTIIESLIHQSAALQQCIGSIKGLIISQGKAVRPNRKALLDEISSYEKQSSVAPLPSHQGVEDQKRWFNPFRFYELVSWTGVYSAIFIFLWFSIPIWITIEYEKFYQPPFTIGVILVIALLLYLLLVSFLSYFWVTMVQIKFVESINENCRRYILDGDTDIFVTQKKYGYNFFTSSLKVLVEASSLALKTNLEKFNALKSRLEAADETLTLQDLQSLNDALK